MRVSKGTNHINLNESNTSVIIRTDLRLVYSYLSATIGSTFIARRAGT